MPVVERPCGNLFGMSNVTLALDLAHWLPDDPPAPASVRATTANDIPDLGRLYFKSYPPGVACATTEEAVADIEESFAGEYGEYWPEASPVGEIAGELFGAVMTVRQAPSDRTPEGPFIIELFTDPAHRQLGLLVNRLPTPWRRHEPLDSLRPPCEWMPTTHRRSPSTVRSASSTGSRPVSPPTTAPIGDHPSRAK